MYLAPLFTQTTEDNLPETLYRIFEDRTKLLPVFLDTEIRLFVN